MKRNLFPENLFSLMEGVTAENIGEWFAVGCGGGLAPRGFGGGQERDLILQRTGRMVDAARGRHDAMDGGAGKDVWRNRCRP